jgi:transcriptional regulator with XRE-family HTH domain
LNETETKRIDFHNQRLHAVVTKPYNTEDKAEKSRVQCAVAVAQLIIDVPSSNVYSPVILEGDVSDSLARNPSSEYVLKIANALGASIDYLLRGDEASQPSARGPVTIPPELADAAVRLSLTYAQTVELLEAHKSVIARRSNREVKRFEVDDWIALHRAIKTVFG